MVPLVLHLHRYGIWNIEFPAVTICSNNKVVARKLRASLRRKPWNETHEDHSGFCANRTELKNKVSDLCIQVLKRLLSHGESGRKRGSDET